MLTTLLLLAVSAGPESLPAGDALEKLSMYGKVPEHCEAQETIEGGELDHSHRFAPPKALLPGKAKELIPYTQHPDRRVVLRAALLLCFEGSPAAREQLVALAKRWPCERELLQAAWAFGAQLRPSCPDGERMRDRELLLTARAEEVTAWAEQPDPNLLAGLRADLPRAWAQAMEMMTWIDRSRARAAVKALAALDTASAIRRLLTESKATLARHDGGSLKQVFDGVGMMALGAFARRTQQSPAQAMLEVVRTATAADVEALSELQLEYLKVLEDQSEAARALLRQPGTTTEGRALLEKVVSRKAKPGAWFDRQNQLSEWERVRDRPSLRTYVKDESLLHADRRAAAIILAKLGDATGLYLWESKTGLTPDEQRARSEDLIRLLGQAQGPARSAAQKLFDSVWK